jgi:hypothetical protein
MIQETHSGSRGLIVCEFSGDKRKPQLLVPKNRERAIKNTGGACTCNNDRCSLTVWH